MEDQNKKSLSEISHLFLSSVRENATGGVRPMRLPPQSQRNNLRSEPSAPTRSNVSVDLTPEEYARVIEEGETADQAELPPIGPVSAIICSQFHGQQLERAREYARHLAVSGDRIGLIELDVTECRVSCFELSGDETAAAEPATINTGRQMGHALEELASDIDRWVLLLPSPRLPEARTLLKKVNHWVLLSTCDHDGVVSCYRAIKGLAEIPRPRLTLALLNAPDKNEAGKVYRKIAGVCEQFLSWKMEAEQAVEPTDCVSEHLALTFRPVRDRTEAGAGPQWNAVADFLSRAQIGMPEPVAAKPGITTEMEPASVVGHDPIDARISSTEPKLMPQTNTRAEKHAAAPSPVWPAIASNGGEDDCDIADLPTGEVTESAVLSAVIRRSGSGLIECPIHPPTCPDATLAVGRDHRLVLLAVARKGLGELRAIAQAYRWVIENRPLLSMALPQFSIDTHALPSLKLMVDHADSDADLLIPMNENSNITVQTYRKLKWSGRTGLLLEAA